MTAWITALPALQPLEPLQACTLALLPGLACLLICQRLLVERWPDKPPASPTLLGPLLPLAALDPGPATAWALALLGAAHLCQPRLPRHWRAWLSPALGASLGLLGLALLHQAGNSLRLAWPDLAPPAPTPAHTLVLALGALICLLTGRALASQAAQRQGPSPSKLAEAALPLLAALLYLSALLAPPSAGGWLLPAAVLIGASLGADSLRSRQRWAAVDSGLLIGSTVIVATLPAWPASASLTLLGLMAPMTLLLRRAGALLTRGTRRAALATPAATDELASPAAQLDQWDEQRRQQLAALPALLEAPADQRSANSADALALQALLQQLMRFCQGSQFAERRLQTRALQLREQVQQLLALREAVLELLRQAAEPALAGEALNDHLQQSLALLLGLLAESEAAPRPAHQAQDPELHTELRLLSHDRSEQMHELRRQLVRERSGDPALPALLQLSSQFEHCVWLLRRLALLQASAGQQRQQGQRQPWRGNRLLQGLGDDLLHQLEPLLRPQRLAAGELLYQAGDAAEQVWLITAGELLLQHPGQAPTSPIAPRGERVGAGEALGELELLQQLPRQATAVACGEVELWALDRSALQAFERRSGYALLPLALARQQLQLGEQLDQARQRGLQALQQGMEEFRLRSAFGTVLSNLILLIFVYTSALSLLRQIAKGQATTTFVTSTALAAMALTSWWMVRQTGFKPAVFGFSLARWRWVLIDSLHWTFWACALCTLLKLLLIKFVPHFAELALISPWVAKTGWRDTLAAYALYIVCSPVQEFVARGAIQGCLQHMLTGRHAAWRAIIVADAVFSISHQHLGPGYALIVFIPGLFWGWMYSRQRSLLGVSVSHVLIGLWVTGALDLASVVGD
ncbi:cyclic nucleotide-binding domain-containing protein [Paucibacter sp. APW11]|uniref:Cyclic nucleotide-binding domain-containing protein n=1 Tax=Roseateles aquae TaxID=3077235 RepID=A0ABU3P7R9_9BURK|nr:cyclic nucleotide-binding domain-containing protein [Paucibacter sp. APW11]MDT8998616.1 cyclic nucleotide-binding domain-containing protein [Paucibacter sp. APW11]